MSLENIIYFMTGLVAGVGICVSIFNLFFTSKEKEEKGGYYRRTTPWDKSYKPLEDVDRSRPPRQDKEEEDQRDCDCIICSCGWKLDLDVSMEIPTNCPECGRLIVCQNVLVTQSNMR